MKQPHQQQKVQSKQAQRQSQAAPLQAQEQDQAEPRSKRGWLYTAAAVAACTAIALGVSLGVSGGDQTPDAEELKQMQANLTYLQEEGLPAVAVAEEEREQAIASMNLPQEEAQKVAQAVQSGQTDLVWLTLWDNYDEDGDVVVVESDWLRTVVPLTNAGATVAVPRPSSGVINVRAQVDGQGGVTLGFIAEGTGLSLPPLPVGNAVGIKVR